MIEAPTVGVGGAGPDRWRARVQTHSGDIRGAGIVLDALHVLTCAHVVPPQAHPDPDGTPSPWNLQVDAVGGIPVQRRRARVMPTGWVPRQASVDHIDDGDLALLELDAPLDAISITPLHQLALKRGTQLSAYGFPHHGTSGVWARTIARGSSGELLQVDAADRRGAEIGRGFSGAGMVDSRGRVVGMVVSRLAGSTAGISWMMPVEAILRYLPVLRHQVQGIPAAPPSMVRHAKVGPVTRAEVRRITDLLALPQNTLLIVTGERGGRRRVIDLLAVSTTAQKGGPPMPGPPPGTIDLALDVAGMTTAQVATRIAQRLGVEATGNTELLESLRSSGTGVTVVVDDVDHAEDPVGLMKGLLVPLSELEFGIGRIVVGTGKDPGITSRNSRSLPVPDDGPTGTVGERLERLDRVITQLRAAEAEATLVRTAFTGSQTGPPRADALRLRVAVLHRHAYAPQVPAALAEAEASAARALHRAQDLVTRQAEWQELRALLDVYQAKAAAADRAEDMALAGLFEQASAALDHTPCDLARCRDAVDAYQTALWQRPGLTEPSRAQPTPQIEDHG